MNIVLQQRIADVKDQNSEINKTRGHSALATLRI